MFGRKKKEAAAKSYPQGLEGYEFCYQRILNNPHCMIAGTTGSGKSVLIGDIIYSLTAYDPTCVKYMLFDLKRIELAKWANFPHCIGLVTEPEDVLPKLKYLCDLMDSRYETMKQNGTTECRNPHIYIIIDEFTELLDVKQKVRTKDGVQTITALDYINRIMRLARAANIHVIGATQDPSRTSGIPARVYKNASITIGLRCQSAVESRQIIGTPGCEELPRHGYCYIRNGIDIDMQEIPLLSEEELAERKTAYGVA